MSKRSLYVVCKTLDQPLRLIGLTLDEFIPAAILFSVFFGLGKVLTSLVVSFLSVIIIRVMKKGQGSSWILNWCYWTLPLVMTRLIFQHTPGSHQREWVS